jgi:hypothetical protein
MPPAGRAAERGLRASHAGGSQASAAGRRGSPTAMTAQGGCSAEDAVTPDVGSNARRTRYGRSFWSTPLRVSRSVARCENVGVMCGVVGSGLCVRFGDAAGLARRADGVLVAWQHHRNRPPYF